MRMVLVLLAGMMLAVSVPAHADCGGGNGSDDPPSQGCQNGGGNGGNGGGEGGTGGDGYGGVGGDGYGGTGGDGYGGVGGDFTNTNTNDNTNTNTNTNTQGQAQGQIQGQMQGQVAEGGDATATGGNATVGDVSGGSINIYGGSEEGGDAPFSVNSDIDNTNRNVLNGGDSIARSNSSTTIGDTTLNNDSNSTSGAAIIIGGGYGNGECYDDECGGGDAPFTNTNDVDIDNNSTATTGDQITNVDNTDNSFNGGNTLIVGGGEGGEGEGGGTLNSNAENTVDVANDNTSTAVNEGNNTDVNVEVTVESQDVPTANSQTVEGDEINVDARTINEASTVKPAVNSVAPSFSGICNSGAAGQGRGFALSLAVTNDVCQALMMADAYMALGDVEEARKWVEAAARHAGWKGGLGYVRHLVTLGIL